MNRRHLFAIFMALPLLGVTPALAQSPAERPSANPQTARGIPSERVPSAEQLKRERINEEHDRRLREYLEQVARMA
jgi:hypothetical protein